jgi:hypothetical protein
MRERFQKPLVPMEGCKRPGRKDVMGAGTAAGLGIDLALGSLSPVDWRG